MSDGEKELFKAVTDSLQEKGVLGDLSAIVRAHVLHILKQDEPTEAKNLLKTNTHNFVINELVKEYLEWNNLKHAKDVLVLESGHPQESLTRSQLEEVLNIKTGLNASKVPLLYTLVSAFTKKSD